nr:MAG TPA: hypothetical protein [Caudoviricetes sp.]
MAVLFFIPKNLIIHLYSRHNNSPFIMPSYYYV